MYVAKRAFRNYNQMVLPGSIVEPGSTKWFKTRLKDKVIVEVNAHNFDMWYEYFKAKYGVTLDKEQTKDAEVDAPIDESTDTSDEEPAEVPKIVKVVVPAK